MAAKRSSREPESELFYTFQDNPGNGNVPAFLSKLWVLVSDPSNEDIICWDQNGTSFHIYDQSRFAAEVLPYYFKHNNISSFIRQLNMYGFRKVPNLEHGGLKVERDDLEFQHQYFVRGNEALLDRIKRKTGPGRVEQRPLNVNPDNLNKVLSDVNQIKAKQDTFNASMEGIRRENAILWKEVIKLSKMQQQQQQIINKIMHFLLSLVNKRGRGMAGLPRKRPLMINAAPQPTVASESPTPSKKANIVLNEAGDHDYTVQSPSSAQSPGVPNTSGGVVIQELLDHFDSSVATPNPENPESSGEVSESSSLDYPTVSFLSNPPSVQSPAPTVDEALLSPTFIQSLLPTSTESPKAQQQQPMTSQEIALRGIKDKPLSSSSNAKDLTEQMRILQHDLDSVRETLSSGQFNLDPNFIMGLMDFLPTEDNGAENPSTLSAQVSAAAPDTISGNELSQYQPTDLTLSSLFDDLDAGVPQDADADNNFLNSEVAGLNTPRVEDTKSPFPGGKEHLTLEDLD